MLISLLRHYDASVQIADLLLVLFQVMNLEK